MTTSEMIKCLCDEKDISISELARRLGQSPQNFGKKLKRETVTLEELTQIAELTGASFEQTFVMDNGLKISTGESEKGKRRSRKGAAIENDVKDVLLNISREIRTPLSTIVGFADMAMNFKGNSQKLAAYTEKIKYSAEHITKLIDNMIELAELDKKEKYDSEVVVNMKDSVEQFSDYVTELSTTNGCKINYEFRGIEEVEFYCDRDSVNQAVKILLSDAIRYAPKGTDIDVIVEAYEADEQHIGIRYIINNPSDVIETDDYEKILEIINDENCKFDWMNFNAGQLELAVVRKSIKHLNGKIKMTTGPENGTKVVMDFVFKLADPDDNQKEESFAGKKILVVEDNVLNREILKELLGIVGITTEIAEDGVDAVERVREMGKNYYDAILMDIQMPRMDGYEATAKIREICGDRRIPIIAVTANAFEEDRQRSLESGLDAHVSKPVDYNKLLVLLKKFISGRR